MSADFQTSRIACVVLTKNEEENVRRCLASVSWCVERIVVDSGSTDRTPDVATASGARVVVNRPDGVFNIARQRNWALESAGVTAEWVLFLDADEEASPALRAEIERAIATNSSANAYELTPRYLFWGRWLKRTQGYPNWHARLLRRGEVAFVGGVWEHFDKRARIGRIFEPYDHYANSKGFSDWLARHDRYSSWDAAKVAEFLESGDARALGTERKSRLRRLAARWWPLRPWVRFIHMYFLRLGFLEGFPAFVFCFQYFFYEWMTVIKIIELKRRKSGKPL